MATVDLDLTDLEALNSVETRELFDVVDRLSSLGVGGIVDLPQIIVVGDQSSGKSSVLQAISGVHFPAAEGVCTRFATELSLRPGIRRSVTATVQFADGRRPAESLQVADFNQDDMAAIIRDAKDKMGISDDGRGFSSDVLRLNIEWPDMYRLTLVDLPGIFHAETADQSDEGRSTVMALLDSYMRNRNSIILAIISAQSSLAHQAVMRHAREHDPNKARTLGVLTKPDLLRPGSTDEQAYLRAVRGLESVNRLGLGWHVMRNLDAHEQDRGPRDAVEDEFLQSEPWASLPPSSRGVAALRVKLSRILHDHIKKGLPTVLENIQTELSRRQAEKRRLGNARSTTDEMRAYLIDIAVNFERLVQNDIRGQYHDSLCCDAASSQQHLRSQLRNLNRGLRHVLLVLGAAQVVSDRPPHDTPPVSLLPQGYLGDFLQDCGYMDGLPRPERITSADLASLLERQAAHSQGMEFPGNANTHVMVRFFQGQIRPWQRVAERHLEKVMHASKAFVEGVLERVAGPFSSNRTTRAIVSTYVDDFFDDKERELAAKLEELLRPYRKGYALPLDHDFHEEMARRAAEAVAGRRGSVSSSEQDDSDSESPPRRSAFGTKDMIETVQIFYDMALRTFTENLINLAVEGCLIQDLPGIFTPQLVSCMERETVERLAAESEEVRHSRSQLERDIELLEQGLEACRPYRTRAALTVPSTNGLDRPQRTAGPEESPGDREQTSSTTTLPASGPQNAEAPDRAASSLFASASATPSTSNGSSSNSLFPAPSPANGVNRPVSKFTTLPAKRIEVGTGKSKDSGGLFSGISSSSSSSNPSGPARTSSTPSNGAVSPGGLFAGSAASPAGALHSMPLRPAWKPGDGAFDHRKAPPNTPGRTASGQQPSDTQVRAPGRAQSAHDALLPSSVFHVWQPTGIPAPRGTESFQHLCMSPAFSNYSPEEIRLRDHSATRLWGLADASCRHVPPLS